MGAVDMFDQYRSYVQIDVRSRKYWHPIFWFIVEAALINSWLLYKASRQLALLPVEYTLFTFRKSIALALAAEWEGNGCKNRTCMVSPTKAMRQSPAPIRSHLRRFNIDNWSRFTTDDGHISALQKLPLKEGSKLKVRQMRCQHCKTSRTTYWCKECQQPLCMGKCFQQFHSLTASPTVDKHTTELSRPDSV
jgi:hypothetical protein